MNDKLLVFKMDEGYIFVLLPEDAPEEDGLYDAIIVTKDDDDKKYIVELCEVQPTDELMSNGGVSLDTVPTEYLALLLQTAAEFTDVTETMPAPWDPNLSMKQQLSSTSSTGIV